MKAHFDVGHPAHVHLFKHAIDEVEARGHDTLVTSREKEVTTSLLDAYGIDHVPISKKGTTTFDLAKGGSSGSSSSPGTPGSSTPTSSRATSTRARPTPRPSPARRALSSTTTGGCRDAGVGHASLHQRHRHAPARFRNELNG